MPDHILQLTDVFLYFSYDRMERSLKEAEILRNQLGEDEIARNEIAEKINYYKRELLNFERTIEGL